MLRILLIRPGCTDFDQQRRIKGSLDIPLNQQGRVQVEQAVGELAGEEIDAVYVSPCQSAIETGSALAPMHETRLREIDGLKNLDHGLWHGKLIDEVKKNQPKVYRQWQEHPETVCPPGGETLQAAADRARKAIKKILRKHRDGTVALVINEPMARLVANLFNECDLGNFWQAECDGGTWESFEVEPTKVLAAPG